MFIQSARARLAQMKIIAAASLLLAVSISTNAQQNGSVTAVAPAPKDPFADTLAGVKATGETKRYSAENLSELVADRAQVFREYRVVSAASRLYGSIRVEVFQTDNQFAAFGLFSCLSAAKDPKAKTPAIGSQVAALEDEIMFYKGDHFARVTNAEAKKKAAPQLRLSLAQALAQAIPPGNESLSRPTLLEQLAPAIEIAKSAGYIPASQSERYFLGPASLGAFVERGSEMFIFPGEAEAVMIECRPDISDPRAPIKFVIVEYHTPQFATDAMQQAESFLQSLSESERNRINVRREGNYLVAAVTADSSEVAAQMVDAIKYPYHVKWLRNPLLPTNDPFRTQKAAAMLLSTFAILGLILLTVGAGGAIFGATAFLRRRRLQREAFSDAGGMLRLDLDPMESAILGLPPHREGAGE